MNTLTAFAAAPPVPRLAVSLPAQRYSVVDDEAAARRREAFEARKLAALAALPLETLIARMPRDASPSSVAARVVLFSRMSEIGVGCCQDLGWHREADELLEETGLHAVLVGHDPYDVLEVRLLLSDGSIWRAGGALGMVRAETER